MGKPSQTQYYRRPPRIEVKVTRRHHPLEGQVLDVTTEGPTQIVVRLSDGTTMRLPRSWTDADGPPPLRPNEGVFTIDALRELLERIEALRRRG
jgi:hypothetical protein